MYFSNPMSLLTTCPTTSHVAARTNMAGTTSITLLFLILLVRISTGNLRHCQETLPNIVLFLVDDLGYGDLGCFGNETVSTPNVDKLAVQGVRFTRMYSHATCTPSRASLLTGRLPVRQGLMKGRIFPFDVLSSAASDAGLPHQETTIAEVLREHGYTSAMFGKWHLGLGRGRRFLPTHHGFDYFLGTLFSHGVQCTEKSLEAVSPGLLLKGVKFFRKILIPLVLFVILLWLVGLIKLYFAIALSSLATLSCIFGGIYIFKMMLVNPTTCILFRNDTILEQPYSYENLTLRYTAEAISFMKKNIDEKKPFFLYMAYNKMHPPVFVSPYFKNATGRGAYQDGLVEMDWGVGKITTFLRNEGLENNTLVIFLSDNGPELYRPAAGTIRSAKMRGSTGVVRDGRGQFVYLRGQKTNNWEGGIRVPGILKWSGKIQENRTIHVTTSLMDIFPTVFDLIGIPFVGNKDLDGKSLLPLLTNQSLETSHQFLFHYCDMTKPGAVTHGRYKVHFMRSPGVVSCNGATLDPPLLFDIENDPSENNPLKLEDYEDIMANITQAVDRHLATRTDDEYGTWSQYDYMLWPWLFPCANFPFCRQRLDDDQRTTYDELFN